MASDREKSTSAHHGVARPLPPDVTEAAVREQLERIRASAPFRSSRNCLVFLDYIVNATLDGRVDSLRERTLGTHVFGRDADYDTNDDPVVRATATQVRRRLAQYYQGAGHEQELRIDLPTGSYQPEFHLHAEETHAAPATHTASRTRGWILGATSVLCVAVLLLFAIERRERTPQSVVDRFWAPVLEGSGPVLLCVGQPKAYNFLEPLETELNAKLPRQGQPPLPPDKAGEKISVPLDRIIPMWDRYVALGDAICLSDVAGVMSRHARTYHIRGGASTTFADLRESPAVLIGTFTNEWTQRLTGELRYSFQRDPNGACPHVFDRLNPANRKWQLCGEWPDWKMPVDYAIVSRVRDATTGNVVVTAAGITQYGTAAAGEFLSNPSEMSEALRQAPGDWPKKNLQVVLITRVIGGTAGPPSVLATYAW